YVTGRTPSDPHGTMEAPVLAQAGQQVYEDFGPAFAVTQRAGDLSGINVDSAGNFWAINEFADDEALPTTPDNPVGDPNNPAADWGTAIAAFSVGAPSAQLNGSVLRVDGTAGADELSVRVSATDSTKLGGVAGGSVVGAFGRSAVTSIKVQGHEGDDTFTVDDSNGSPLPKGGITFDGGAGSDGLVGPNLTNTWSLSAAGGGKIFTTGGTVF